MIISTCIFKFTLCKNVKCKKCTGLRSSLDGSNTVPLLTLFQMLATSANFLQLFFDKRNEASAKRHLFQSSNDTVLQSDRNHKLQIVHRGGIRIIIIIIITGVRSLPIRRQNKTNTGHTEVTAEHTTHMETEGLLKVKGNIVLLKKTYNAFNPCSTQKKERKTSAESMSVCLLTQVSAELLKECVFVHRD